MASWRCVAKLVVLALVAIAGVACCAGIGWYIGYVAHVKHPLVIENRLFFVQIWTGLVFASQIVFKVLVLIALVAAAIGLAIALGPVAVVIILIFCVVVLIGEFIAWIFHSPATTVTMTSTTITTVTQTLTTRTATGTTQTATSQTSTSQTSTMWTTTMTSTLPALELDKRKWLENDLLYGEGMPPKPVTVIASINAFYFFMSWSLSGGPRTSFGRVRVSVAKLVFMTYQLLLSFYGSVWAINWIVNNSPFYTSWATYNYVVFVIVSSNHFNTGVQLMVDLWVEGEDDDGPMWGFIAFIVCSAGVPVAAIFTHTIPMLLVYCWMFVAWGLIIALFFYGAEKHDETAECLDQVKGQLWKMTLSIALTTTLQMMPQCAVMCYLGGMRRPSGYLAPVEDTMIMALNHTNWADSVQLALYGQSVFDGNAVLALQDFINLF